MIFGIDVGGTTVKVGIVENNKIIDKYEITTKKETLFEDVCLSLKEYINEHKIENLEGIGFGVPGNVINNYIYNLPNIGIKNVDIVEEVHKYFPGVKVVAQNDANVAALGEMLYHNEYNSACMITLGTGLGAGIVIDGKLLEGKHGAAGELGHMPIADYYNFQCGCGLKGCLETVASATGVVRLAKYHFNEFDTELSGDFTAKDIFDLARKNDPLCSFVVDRLAYYVAKAIAIMSVNVDVDVCYIGGGVSKAGDILIDAIKKNYEKLAFFAVKSVKIESSTLLNDAGMLGSAGLVK